MVAVFFIILFRNTIIKMKIWKTFSRLIYLQQIIEMTCFVLYKICETNKTKPVEYFFQFQFNLIIKNLQKITNS